MKRYIILIFSIVFVLTTLTGCFGNDINDINDEIIETFEVIKSEEENNGSSPIIDEILGNNNENSTVDTALNDKFASIDFYQIAGIYTRNVQQDDIEVMEMFAQDKNSFLRIASNDLEKEVYAYNYVMDEFTYLYYFDSELISKTVINVTTGKIERDDAGYASLIADDATALKDYFYELINTAGIILDELAV